MNCLKNKSNQTDIDTQTKELKGQLEDDVQIKNCH